MSDLGNGNEARGAFARERRDLLAAFRRTAGEQGYRALTIEVVTRTAGLPRERFDVHFDSKEEALAAVQEEFLEGICREAESSCVAETGWPEGVRAALGSILGRMIETETLTRALMVEAPGQSFAARQRQTGTLDRLAAMLAGGRRLYPRAAELPPLAERVLIGGVASVIAERLLGEDAATLRGLVQELLWLLLMPYLGIQEARRFVEAG
ncbi:MAG TPA: TetR/AcrR family transcriptional regulator [Thermoanaerobaculia bacterium]|nr:TetR/AcrR family transcriptional regulator [Thermoanaerobaculia bacterium]